jgi:hypothetical protein
MKPFMQFKQYPLMVSTLLCKTAGRALHGDPVAMKQFAYMMGTAATLTGVNGLPTEILKYPMLAAATATGGKTPLLEDEEDKGRRWLAENVGPEVANLIMNGVSSVGPAAVDVHHRLGYGSMWSFGEPDPGKPQDITNWLENTVLGAPGAALGDAIKGTQALANGQWGDAVEALAPSKEIRDATKAASELMNGKPTPKGNPGMRPLTVPETIMQGLGFTPRSVSDYGTARHYAEQEIKDEPKKTKPGIGPKGQTILGIAASRKSKRTLESYADDYGVQ